MRCEINQHGISVESDVPPARPVSLLAVRRFFNCCNITGFLALLTSLSALQIFLSQLAFRAFRYSYDLPYLPEGAGSIFRILCACGIALSVASVALSTFTVSYYSVNQARRVRYLPGFIASLASYAFIFIAVLFCIFSLI